MTKAAFGELVRMVDPAAVKVLQEEAQAEALVEAIFASGQPKLPVKGRGGR